MIALLYKKCLKPVLFLFDPEIVHLWFVELGQLLGRSSFTRKLVELIYGYRKDDASLTVDGIHYKTPVLLAAGFDYNAKLVSILKSVAFGGVEVGSITAIPTEGNPKPRLTRLIKSRSLLVFKGLRNDGVDAVLERLRHAHYEKNFVIGISIARSNSQEAVSLEGGIADYHSAFEKVVASGLGDYYTINISCPNVYGGESFASPERLRPLLTKLSTIKTQKPLYLKMPISVSDDTFDALLDVAKDFPVNGLIIGNLNKDYHSLDHQDEVPKEYRGGLSGKPCRTVSTRLISRAKDRCGTRFTIIGCGGILSVEDAMEKFNAGADLLQLISGMIFEGPHLMKKIAGEFAARRRAESTQKYS